ncbi:PAS domain S-box protein [Algoriphagus resistens]|uniref:PAS domain S-box protein n=1 Tax=Algoriphagus resistens TaxID=1750590 RepID=UPI0009EBAD2C|nr:PAS domain S-box protein [Algoriphagus resistens]
MNTNSGEDKSKPDPSPANSYQNFDAEKDVSLYRICKLSTIVCSGSKSLILFKDPDYLGLKAEYGATFEGNEALSFFKEQTLAAQSLISCEEVKKLAISPSLSEVFEVNDIKSFVGLPLRNDKNEWIGCLVVFGSTPMSLDGDCKTALELLASEALVIFQERSLIAEFSNVEKLFSLSNDLICIAGTDGFFKKINPSFTQLLGWDDQTLLARPFYDFIHPEDMEGSRKQLGKLVSGELTVEFIHRFQCKDGSYKTLDWVATPERQTGNIYGIARDITDSREKEKQLEKSESRLRVFFENSQGLMCTHDLAGVFLSVNEAGANKLGYTAEQVIGRSLYDIVPEQRHPLIDEYLGVVKEKGKASGQMITRHRDGSLLIWMYNNVLENDQGGDGEYVIGNAIDITQRVSLEEKLTQARSLLEETGKIAKVGGWNFDVETNKLTWTPMTRLIHEVPEDFEPDVSTGISFYKEGESRNKITQAWKQALENGIPWEFELQIVSYKGNEKWVRAIGQVEFRESKCVRIHGTFQDIDESKTAQIELDQTRKVLDNVINASSEVCVISTDMEGVITVFNSGAEKMLGYSADEVVGRLKPDFIHKPEEVRQRVLELEHELGRKVHPSKMFTTIADRDGVDQRDWTFITKSGDEISVSLVISPMRDHEDNTIGYLGIAIDNTEKKKIQQDLINEKSRLSAFVQHAPAAVAMLDKDLRYIAASNQWKKDYNLKNQDIIGQSHYDLFPQLDEEVRARLQRVLGGEIERREEDKIRLFGEIVDRYVTWELRPWYLHDGEVGGIMLFTQDITGLVRQREELKKAKLQADEASIAKSEFLANMSHEIRTPLNGVIGFTDLVLKTKLNETQLQYLTIVNQSANALLSIINDILDFSKIEAGKLELDIEKCDLYELCSQATDIITYQIQQKGVEMLLNIGTDLPRFVHTDSVRLKQILVNLLGNASKFTERGEIELKIENIATLQGANTIRFAVRDTGVGIKPENQNKIFEAFEQEDSSTTKKYGGSGLGLAISNSLLRMMNSKLQLESELGKGSRFYFEVTLNTEQGEAVEWNDVSKIKKVLIVDDNENNRLIVRQMLLLQNIPSVEASTGFEALQILASGESFDVILMDYHMPFMDGLETIRKIRESFNPDPEALPIMLLHSSSDDQKIISACKEFGVHHRLIKPIKIQDFYHSLSHIHTSEFKSEEAKSEESEDSSLVFTVLLAEDNQINMLLAKTIINKIAPKATIVQTSNGYEALEYCKRELPDLILMDVQMPEMNGYEATKKIRAIEQNVHTPIIAFTAGNVKGEREKCIQAGMDDFVVKPIVEEDILVIFQKWLDWDSTVGVHEGPEKANEANEHYNPAKLQNYSDNDPIVLSGLLEIVESELKKSLESFEKHIELQDLKRLNEAGHKLYGTSITTGMQTLAKIAFQFEHLDSFEEGIVGALYDSLKNEIRIVLELVSKQEV